jgi:hypothetical protein
VCNGSVKHTIYGRFGRVAIPVLREDSRVGGGVRGEGALSGCWRARGIRGVDWCGYGRSVGEGKVNGGQRERLVPDARHVEEVWRVCAGAAINGRELGCSTSNGSKKTTEE